MKTNKIWKQKEKDIILHKDGMNIIESCIDRHADEDPNKLALLFESEKGKITRYTYKQLQDEVNKFANLLSSLKIKKNSRIFLFLPKVPELYIGFLGTIKQGSIAIPLFEAFQKQGLEMRLKRGNANVIITNKELSKRLTKNIKNLKSLKQILIIDEKKYKDKIKKQSNEFKTVLKNKKDTAIMMFTSSTAGTPVAGIEIPHYALVQQHFTGQYALGLDSESNYWCTAHPGWVTGSVYGIIAPFSIGCSNFIYQGHFKARRWINFIKKNKISEIYTAPTALRLLKHDIKRPDLKTINNLSSVGEALTPTTFKFYKRLGLEINDTYWQTETGAIMIANIPSIKRKPGSMGKAIPGITAKIKNKEIVLKPDWPAIMTRIYKHPKMYKSYFREGWFTTHDMAEKKNGYFFFKHRKDDVIKTSGERVSPIEIESILMKHKAVKEAAVIGIPDKIKGHILKAFIVLGKQVKGDEKLKKQLATYVKKDYAGHSYPKQIEFIKKLPKTNSGKIIRMKLREQEAKKN